MKVIYNHPSIPPKGILIGETYEMKIQKDKVIISNDSIKLEVDLKMAKELFKFVEDNKK